MVPPGSQRLQPSEVIWISFSSPLWMRAFLSAATAVVVVVVILSVFLQGKRNKRCAPAQKERLLFFFHVVEPCIKPSQKVKNKISSSQPKKMTTFISASRSTLNVVCLLHISTNAITCATFYYLVFLLARSSKSNNIFILLFFSFSSFKIRRHLVFLVSLYQFELCACAILSQMFVFHF